MTAAATTVLAAVGCLAVIVGSLSLLLAATDRHGITGRRKP